MSTGGDGEVFLSLDEDEVLDTRQTKRTSSRSKATKPSKKAKKAAKKDVEAVLDAEVLDTTFVQQASGTYNVSWPLLGMDCPDCAGKATRALNFLPQVSGTNVSATLGTVRIDVDLERGSLAEASSVLRSLGHAPDVEYNELVGVRSAAVAHRNGVDQRKLLKIFKLQPGVLDAEITDDERILVQFPPDTGKNLYIDRDASLSQIIGSPVKYASAQSNRIRPVSYTHLTLPTKRIV